MKPSPLALLLVLFSASFLVPGCTSIETAVDKAVKNNDPRFCDDLEEPSDRQTCYKQVAVQLNDPEACYGAGNPDACITNYAIEEKDPKACDKAKDGSGRLACHSQYSIMEAGEFIGGVLDDLEEGSCETSCDDWGKSCHMICIKDKAIEFKACDYEYDNKSIMHEYCQKSADATFHTCMDECYTDTNACLKTC